MASTVTLAATSTRDNIRSIFKSKRDSAWPDPRLSIGESWCMLGRNRCWEPIGPAKEIINRVFGIIKGLLESQNEYLNEGVCIPRAILFDLYMIGRTEDKARPTIIFSCENKIPRQRAAKIVRASTILEEFPGVQLGDSSRPLRLSHPPMLLGDQNESEDVPILDVQLVYYFPPLTDLYGIAVAIGIGERDGIELYRRATIGGIVHIGDKVFGVTVGHVFFDVSDDPGSGRNDAIEYSLEFESDDEVIDNEDQVEITSQGSFSPERVAEDDSATSDDAECIQRHEYATDSSIMKGLPSFLPIAKKEEDIPTETQMMASKKVFGRLSAIFRQGNSQNLDWALVQLDRMVIPSLSDLIHNINVQRFVTSLPERAQVKVITHSGRITEGTISGVSTFMQRPDSIAFQEMWTVHLDGPLQFGDCGSWVVDYDGRVLYGYLTAGDPQTRIGYIIPAYQAFSDMEKQLNAKISFPSFETLIKTERIEPDIIKLPIAVLDANYHDIGDNEPLQDELPEENGSWISSNQGMWDIYIEDSMEWSSLPTTPSQKSMIDLEIPPQLDNVYNLEHDYLSQYNSLISKDTANQSRENMVDYFAPGITLSPLPTNAKAEIICKDEASCKKPNLHMETRIVPKESMKADVNTYSAYPESRGLHLGGLRRTIWDSERRKRVYKMRKVRACWRCWLLHYECSINSPCRNCTKATQSVVPDFLPLPLPCFRDPLVSLSTFVIPEYLWGYMTHQNLNAFIRENAISWGGTKISIQLNWGYKQPLTATVTAVNHNSKTSEIIIDDKGEHYTVDVLPMMARLQKVSFGISISPMDTEYHKYVHDIVDTDLMSYAVGAYDKPYPKQLLIIICEYYSSLAKVDNEKITLRKAIEIHISVSILERNLIVDETSSKAVQELLDQDFPTCAVPMFAQWQIKSALLIGHHERILEVLTQWEKLLRTNPCKWTTCFTVLIMLILLMEKTIEHACLKCQAKIRYYGADEDVERAYFNEVKNRLVVGMFQPCKEIFRLRFHKVRPLRIDPLRDGFAEWRGEMVPDAAAELVSKLQRLVKEYLQDDIKTNPAPNDALSGSYIGRLAGIFLRDI